MCDRRRLEKKKNEKGVECDARDHTQRATNRDTSRRVDFYLRCTSPNQNKIKGEQQMKKMVIDPASITILWIVKFCTFVIFECTFSITFCV